MKIPENKSIPPIFHRIWFGNTQIPAIYEEWWRGWQRQYPDYEFRTWRDIDIDTLELTAPKLEEAQGFVRKSDIARYEILFKNGGIYIDCDMMPYHRYDFDIEESDLLVCNETDDSRYCSIGFIAARKKHQLFKEVIERIDSTKLNQLPANRETGPWLFGSILSGYTHKCLPPISFYPYLYDEPYSMTYLKSLTKTYGIHIWGASWLDAGRHEDDINNALKTGDLKEVDKFALNTSNEVKKQIQEFTEVIREARRAAIRAANHNFWGDLQQVSDNKPFELVKAIDYLLRRRPDAIIWQIGAADGVLVDPLRPAMILHNPISVLFEPNPWLFDELKRNYLRNERAQFIQCAIGAKSGKMILNAINPSTARTLCLPDWADGISSVYDDRNAIGGKTIGPELTKKIQSCVSRIEIQVLSIEEARALSRYGDPAVLVVDVEGMDAEVINAALDAGMRPEIIQYETQCLPTNEEDALVKRLSINHVIVVFGNDSIAFRRDFFAQYAEELYVEFGVPTIFNDRLGYVLHAK